MIYNGTYRITSPSGTSEDFLIRTQSESSEFYPGERLVYHVKSGDKLSFGHLTSSGIRVWNQRQGTSDEPSFYDKCALMLWSLITDPKSPYLRKGVKITLFKRCIFCNRLLKSPQAQLNGVGDECARQHQDYHNSLRQLELPFV